MFLRPIVRVRIEDVFADDREASDLHNDVLVNGNFPRCPKKTFVNVFVIFHEKFSEGRTSISNINTTLGPCNRTDSVAYAIKSMSVIQISDRTDIIRAWNNLPGGEVV